MELGIVANCYSCGWPIYGPQTITKDEEPTVKYSCKCNDETEPSECDTPSGKVQLGVN